MGYLSCRSESAISTSNSLTPSSSRNLSHKLEKKPIKIQQFDYSDLEAATNGFSDQKLLGKGSHGYVYKAVLGGRLVAVKKPSRAQAIAPSMASSMASCEITNEVDNEIEILSKIQSPRLVNLVGFTNDSKDRLLVVEFMCNGTLYDVIHSDIGYSPPSIVDWAVPLIKKGKLMAIYDPRIAPPKDAIVTKQLAVIAAKCVRSCRERRPSMKDVVHWLTGLSKLVPLHSWNGFNNPCLMVETVGRPVETRSSQLNLRSRSVEDGDMDAQTLWRDIKNSRRVYSDLGISSNLMDLMACIDEDSGFRAETNHVRSHSRFSNRFFSSRFVSGKNHELEAK
ncbi:Serine/threonine-protein kinase-like protein, partial [Cucurbita argyrosperma subsp. sororia]